MINKDEIIVNAFFTNEMKTQITVYINNETETRVENILVGTRKFNKLLEYIPLEFIHQNTTERLKTANIRNKAIAKNFAIEEGYEKKSENYFLDFLKIIFNEDTDQAELFKIKLDTIIFLKEFGNDSDFKIRKQIKKCKNVRSIVEILIKSLSSSPS